MAEFLLEIHLEEIPARMLGQAVEDLKFAIETTLKQADLAFEGLNACGAPRQLTVWCTSIQERQCDRVETVLGPPVRIAYDDKGHPTKALEGFLRKNPGLNPDQLSTAQQPKGEVVAGESVVAGRDSMDILSEAIPRLLKGMHFAKNMRWGEQETTFVRPVRGILALFGGKVIPFAFAGVEAGNESFGHRFHGKRSFQVASIEDYLARKRENRITVDHRARVEAIQAQIGAHLTQVGGEWVPDPDLLEEVADLVECPFVVLGHFDAQFLEIPREVLVIALKEHQKSFCVQDEHGQLMPCFLSVASVPEDSEGLIRKGNEWVLKARLWDAMFFWKSDLKKDFNALRERLNQLMFQRELGSFADKVQRMRRIAETLGETVLNSSQDRDMLQDAVSHCKTDLMTELVFEFPELQGAVGGLLLSQHGEPRAVCRAVYQHYLPVSMDGEMPESVLGALVSLVDKIDTLVGCFAVGLIPKGAKDPYALRRAAQGVIRLMAETPVPVKLSQVVAQSVQTYQSLNGVRPGLETQIMDFLAGRMRHYLKVNQVEHGVIEAVMAVNWDQVDQVLPKVRAIQTQQFKESFRSLALNLKRMRNVIADEADQLGSFDEGLLEAGPERDLWNAFQTLRPKVEHAVQAADYEQAMDLMNAFSEPVRVYFDPGGVFVNTDDDVVRLNRKTMLRTIAELLSLVGDISHLEAK